MESKGIEYKIGDKINIVLEVVEQEYGCEGCFFFDALKGNCRKENKFECSSLVRSDSKGVIFKEINK